MSFTSLQENKSLFLEIYFTSFPTPAVNSLFSLMKCLSPIHLIISHAGVRKQQKYKTKNIVEMENKNISGEKKEREKDENRNGKSGELKGKTK